VSVALHHRQLLSCLIAVLLVTTAVPAVGAFGSTAAPPSADEAVAASPPAVSEAANGTASVDGLRTWVAPRSTDLSNLSAIQAARASGNLTRSNVVAENDTLVLELRASGLAGAIAAEDGQNVTARFFAFLERGGVSMAVPDRPGPEQEYAYLDVTNASAVSVVADSRNGSYYLVVDLPDARIADEDGGVPANNRGLAGEYEANVTLTANSTLTADGQQTATTVFDISDEEADLDTPGGTDRRYLAPRPNQTISGLTTLAPGHRVTVEVRVPDGEARSKTVRVRNATESAGRFAAVFDFGDVAPGANVSIAVRSGGRPLLSVYPDGHGVDGSVVAFDATVNLTDRGLTEQGVLVENAVLSHGGYLAVHRGSADGEVITRSEFLTPGEEFGQFVDFGPALESNTTLVVVAHRSGPGDTLGEPYTENGSVVADSVAFTVERETTTTTTRKRTATAVSSTTHETSVSHTADTTRTEIEGTVPGFGVGTALVALLAGLALGRRRER
jgi:PGF-CTERM protein